MYRGYLFTVIGIYGDNGQRFSETFNDQTAGGAEEQARAWAREQPGSPEIIIAGVVNGSPEVVA